MIVCTPAVSCCCGGVAESKRIQNLMIASEKSFRCASGCDVVAGSKSIQDLMVALKRSAARFRQVMGPQAQRPLPPPNVTGKFLGSPV